MNKQKAKTVKNTKKPSALQVNKQRSMKSRAMDAVKKSKTVSNKPTKAWRKNPEQSDVRGIDDGSKRAKQRNAGAIKKTFRSMGKKGAATRYNQKWNDESNFWVKKRRENTQQLKEARVKLEKNPTFAQGDRVEALIRKKKEIDYKLDVAAEKSTRLENIEYQKRKTEYQKRKTED